MRSLLFLTNLFHGYSVEDVFLVGELRKCFRVVVAHPLEVDLDTVGDSFDAVVVRNIWPTHEYHAAFEKLKQCLLDKGVSVYNPLVGLGDLGGKDYLVDLFLGGFPVVPTVGEVEDIGLLGEVDKYFVKPKFSCDGVGSQVLSRAELLRLNPCDVVIQPFVDVVGELSFVFVDGSFVYAFSSGRRLGGDYDVSLYRPTKKELDVASRFVSWNALPFGVQRVDLCRSKTGELLLLEVEDLAPYLYLFDLPVRIRNKFVRLFVESLEKNLFS